MAKSKAYTCRMGDDQGNLIEEAARTTEYTRADILRRAFRNYVSVNPDEIAAFSGKKEKTKSPKEPGDATSPSTGQSPDFGSDRAVNDESDRKADARSDDWITATGIYDPMRDL